MRRHVLPFIATLGLVAGPVVTATPAAAATACTVTGDTMTISMDGHDQFTLANVGDHVTATADGVVTDCTVETGRATSTLSDITMTSQVPNTGDELGMVLDVNTPFATSKGAAGDPSKLVRITLDFESTLEIDASSTNVAQHWTVHLLPQSEGFDHFGIDLDNDGDVDAESGAAGQSSPTTAEYLETGSGDDVLDVSDTYVTLTGAGNDHVRVRDSGATYLGSGNDTFVGAGRVTPGPGNDTITLDAPMATAVFDEAHDGSDHVVGSNLSSGGLRTVSYSKRTGVLDVSLDGKANDGDPRNGGEHDNIGSGIHVVYGETRGINHLVGSPGDDRLYGGNHADTLRGLAGNDRLDGRAGNDYESGNQGNDFFPQNGAPNGADRILGGLGFDTVSYVDRLHQVLASIDGRVNDGEPGEHDFLDRYVNAIVGGHGWDTLIGNRGHNVLTGGPGTDHVYGRGGDDTLVVADGGHRDYAYGGPGYDTAEVDSNDRTSSVEKRN